MRAVDQFGLLRRTRKPRTKAGSWKHGNLHHGSMIRQLDDYKGGRHGVRGSSYESIDPSWEGGYRCEEPTYK